MLRQDRTIKQFCKRLAAIEQQQVHPIQWPDQDDPGKGGCDAIIDRGGRHFALEHTTLDAIMDQRMDDDRFRKVVLPTEEAILAEYPDSWVHVAIPVHAIPTKANWNKITQDLCKGCIEVLKLMPSDGIRRKFEFPGVPFPVMITRREDYGRPACYAMRIEPDHLETHLENNMIMAITKKRDQLAPYKAQGYPTILLLDSDEMVLVNWIDLAGAFRKAADRETLVECDEVFVAMTFLDPIWIYPLKLYGRLYPDLTEFDFFHDEQCRLTYG